DQYLGAAHGSHATTTGDVMARLEPVLGTLDAELVVVVGDVDSTLAAALTAAKLRIPLAHVEAGLRSRDWSMPEEINRIITDRLSTLLYVTCEDALENLAAEGLDEGVRFVGNPMIDTLETFRRAAAGRDIRRRLSLDEQGYVLVTLHRPTNVDDPPRLAAFCRALGRLADDVPVVFPVHARTRERLRAVDDGIFLSHPGLRLTQPLGYLDFLALMEEAGLVVTDSGGVQEETTVLGVPCLTARRTTERPITLTEGTNQLVDPERPQAIVETAQAMFASGRERRPRRPRGWDGHAAERIVTSVAEWAADRPSGPAV
ncbi:MAG TPA: UDP-N-acetylglucosamine 2-epimerase (non-hydrolyzing), partial [Thermoleophilia bacterium]|nr:UDP-N-acetylglucosamine 2-epimerase (non-hydrolyzing) [Thermoleophilia bacterium]